MSENALLMSAVLLSVIVLSVVLACRGHWADAVAGSRASAGEGARPETTAEDIQGAIQALLDATPAGESGGFVIFVGNRDLDFVQYSLDEDGLLLNWPTFQEKGPERLPSFREQLNRRGFEVVPVVEDGPPSPVQIGRLRSGQYQEYDDGLYAQTGRDAAAARDLTVTLLRKVFGVTDLADVWIELELRPLHHVGSSTVPSDR